MIAYYSCDEIRPTFLLYFLLDDIRYRRSFFPSWHSAHGVQNEPFRACHLPEDNDTMFQGTGALGLSPGGNIHDRLASHKNLQSNPTRRALNLWRKVAAKML
jgi:hypothetical protein